MKKLILPGLLVCTSMLNGAAQSDAERQRNAASPNRLQETLAFIGEENRSTLDTMLNDPGITLQGQPIKQAQQEISLREVANVVALDNALITGNAQRALPASDSECKNAAAQATVLAFMQAQSQVELKEAAAQLPTLNGLLTSLETAVNNQPDGLNLDSTQTHGLPGLLGKTVNFGTIFVKGDALKQVALTKETLQALAAHEKTKPFIQSLEALATKLAATRPELKACERHWLDFVEGSLEVPKAKELFQELGARVKLVLAAKDMFDKGMLSKTVGLLVENPEAARALGIELPASVLEAQDRAKKQAEEVAALRQGQQAMQGRIAQLLEMMKAQPKLNDKQAQ